MSTTEFIEKVKNLRDDFRSLSLTAYYQHKDAFADAHDMASVLVDELEQLEDEGEKESQAGIPVVSEEAYTALEVGSIVATSGAAKTYVKYSPVQWRDNDGVTYMNAEMSGLVTTLLRNGYFG